MIPLRPYQEACVAQIETHFARGARSVCLQIGTGAGKTHTAAEMLRRAVARGERAVFLAHLDSLIEDTYARLVHEGIWAGFVQAGRVRSPLAPVSVCSIQTLHARRTERPAADLIVLDECHRAMAASVRGVLADYPRARLLGLTATPERSDGRPLGDVFQELVEGPSVRWLTAHGYLVAADVIAPPTYLERDLFAHPAEAYRRHAPGSRAIVFAAHIAHAQEITQRFRGDGVAVACVTGETTREVRRALRARVTSGELKVLVGVAVFLEGFDLPALDCVILARPFGATGAYLQAVGRGLRPSAETQKARCTVIDLRGAVHLHGLPDEERAWALSGEAVRRTEALAALRRCEACLAIFRPARRCPRCGAGVDVAARVPRSLSRAERLERVSALPPHERDARYLAQLERVARKRLALPPGAALRWALGRFRRQFKREPHGEVTS